MLSFPSIAVHIHPYFSTYAPSHATSAYSPTLPNGTCVYTDRPHRSSVCIHITWGFVLVVQTQAGDRGRPSGDRQQSTGYARTERVSWLGSEDQLVKVQRSPKRLSARTEVHSASLLSPARGSPDTRLSLGVFEVRFKDDVQEV